MLLGLPLTIVLLSLLDPDVHILLVGASLALLFELLFSHLLSEIIVELLVLKSVLVLAINVLQMRLLILLDALLDIDSLLFAHSLFLIVANDVTHAVHHSLDALTSLCHFLLTCLFLL